MTFLIETLQAVIWLANWSLSNKLLVATRLQQASGDLLAGEPVILPSQDLPVEIIDDTPKVSLQSVDNSFVLHLAATRLDFFQHYRTGPRKEFREIVDEFIARMPPIVKYMNEELRANIPRVAFVAKVINEIPGSVGFTIDHFLKTAGVFSGARRIEFHAHHRFDLNSFPVNRWVRVKTLRSKIDDSDSALLIEIDLNTIPENVGNYGVEDTSRFWSLSSAHAKFLVTQVLNQ